MKSILLTKFSVYNTLFLITGMLLSKDRQNFLSCLTETLHPSNNFPFPLLLALGNLHSTFCFYEFKYFKFNGFYLVVGV